MNDDAINHDYMDWKLDFTQNLFHENPLVMVVCYFSSRALPLGVVEHLI